MAIAELRRVNHFRAAVLALEIRGVAAVGEEVLILEEADAVAGALDAFGC